MAKRKILLVDDSDICREMIRYILETRGYEVVVIANPFSFVTTLNRERPDLALVDVGMAALSGDQLIKLSRMGGRAPCPIVLHSDRPAEELRELVRSSGADGYIAKTGDGEQLVVNIEYFLRFGAPSRDGEPSSSRRSLDLPPPSSRRAPESQSRSESAGPPTSRRSLGGPESAQGPSSTQGPSSSRFATGTDPRLPKKGGSGLYKAVVAALEIPPSTRDVAPTTRRSGQMAAVSPPTAPTPPAPPENPAPPPSRRTPPRGGFS